MTIEKYKKDIERLAHEGDRLYFAMVWETLPQERKKGVKLSDEEVKKLPDFKDDYQSWYSEATACISQLLPGRLEDFVAYYRPQKTRKEITSATYTIFDYLQGLSVTRGYEKTKVVGPDAAIPIFMQQVNIVKALRRRLESSLFDIRTLVQAGLSRMSWTQRSI